MAIFPLRAVLQPALTLAYLVSYSVPRAFSKGDFLAGVVMGFSMILTCLIHFRCGGGGGASSLATPLLGAGVRACTHEHKGCSWIFMLAIIFELTVAVSDLNFSNCLILSMNLYAVLLDDIYIQKWQLLGYICAGVSLPILIRKVSLTETFVAILGGILFGSVATYSLPLWDHGKSTKIGFSLSAISVLTLYLGASTLSMHQ